ncbi:MAG: hypothetical protein LBB21_06190 [Holosporaceae bacterium]|jgi:hypothetical protein|nr:hypothetical protein [Holosporaceae bacterium]
MFLTEVFTESVEKIPQEEEICKNLSLKPSEKLHREVVRYLGYKNDVKVTPEINSLIQKGIIEICTTIEPRTIYRCFSIQNSQNSSLREENNKTFSKNSGITCDLSLHQYNGIILMGATLGVDVDRLLNRTQIRDITYALILDSCATAAIESICDDLQDYLTTTYANQNMYLTKRHSPGYGDLPLSSQTKLLSCLDAERKIGLSTTRNFLLIPTKSVTAIIGISSFEQKNEHISCSTCKMYHVCNFRRSEVL